MTAKEYRICLSDTPAQLASEVQELLAQGWDLYGHPFVGQNGHSGSAVCQAMVRLSEAPVVSAAPATLVAPVVSTPAPVRQPPKPSPPKPAFVRPVRPARPRVAVNVRNVAAFLAFIACGSLLGDVLIFRSGFYGRFLEPESSTGTLERVLDAEVHRRPTGKKEVLVIGNSRLAEDFWAKVANEYKPQDNYWFANSAVAGSAARSWYYLVRDIDPQRNRYAAIAVPLDDFDDPDGIEDPADLVWELRLVVNRLRMMDIVPFTLSYTTLLHRFEVLRGSMFKGVVFQRDLSDLIEKPAARLESVRQYREHGSAWFYDYGGNPQSLAGVSVDWANHRATFPPGMPEGTQQELTRLFFANPPQKGMTRNYQSLWLGRLADLYRGTKTRIIVYQVPRCAVPRPTPLAHLPWTTVDELRKRTWVSVVDRHAFESLEKPELFFDYVHLNVQGRNLFSPMLADAVKEILK